MSVVGVAYADDLKNSLNVQVQTTDSSGNIQAGTYTFTFDISDASDCSNVIYSNETTNTTDNRGILSFRLENVNLSFNKQYWLCYYRDNVLKDTIELGVAPYSMYSRYVENVNNESINSSDEFSFNNIFVWSDLTVSGNIFGSYNINTSGSLNVSGSGYFGGNVGIGTTSPRATLTTVGDVYNNLSTSDKTFQIVNGSGTSLMYVNGTNGNVGIGTASPTGLFDVNNKFVISSLLPNTITVTRNPTYTTYPMIVSAGGGLWLKSTGGRIVLDGSDDSTNGIQIWGGVLSTYSTDFNFKYSGNNLVVFKTNGNVGIGTTSPKATLNVVGDEYHNLSTDAKDFEIVNGSGTSLFFVDSSAKKVGIGTTSPGAKLEVNGTLKIDSTSTFSDDSTFNANIKFPVDKGIVVAGLPGGDRAVFGIDGPDDFTYLQSPDNHAGDGIDFRQFSTGNSLVRILNSGNVGIGTTSPSDLLEVEKDQNAGTQFRVDNNAVGTSATAKVIAESDAALINMISFSSGYTTSNQYIADSGLLEANSASSGGLVLSAAANAPMSFWTQGSRRMDITGSGKVGIGTTVPAHKLTIQDTTANSLNVSSTLFVDGLNGRVGIGNSTPNATLTIKQGGTTIADEWTVRSDRTLKSNIQSYALSSQSSIPLYTYNIDYKEPIYELKDKTRLNEVCNEVQTDEDCIFNNETSQTECTPIYETQCHNETINYQEYEIIGEQQKTKQLLGMMADEAPSEILGLDGKSINLYSYTSYVYAYAQALKKENDKMKQSLCKLGAEEWC